MIDYEAEYFRLTTTIDRQHRRLHRAHNALRWYESRVRRAAGDEGEKALAELRADGGHRAREILHD